MTRSTIFKQLARLPLLALAWLVPVASAEVFYAGDTKGFPGEPVQLTINARAGTSFDAIDIAPFFDSVADVLQGGTLTATDELKQGGSGPCNSQVCGLFYLIFNDDGTVSNKSFAADTLLATIDFDIAASAPAGVVGFNPAVRINVTPLLIPTAQQFEVLAIPEPSNWLLMLLGLGVVAVAAPRCRRAQASFGARRAAVLRSAPRWRVPPRGLPSQ